MLGSYGDQLFPVYYGPVICDEARDFDVDPAAWTTAMTIDDFIENQYSLRHDMPKSTEVPALKAEKKKKKKANSEKVPSKITPGEKVPGKKVPINQLFARAKAKSYSVSAEASSDDKDTDENQALRNLFEDQKSLTENSIFALDQLRDSIDMVLRAFVNRINSSDHATPHFKSQVDIALKFVAANCVESSPIICKLCNVYPKVSMFLGKLTELLKGVKVKHTDQMNQFKELAFPTIKTLKDVKGIINHHQGRMTAYNASPDGLLTPLPSGEQMVCSILSQMEHGDQEVKRLGKAVSERIIRLQDDGKTVTFQIFLSHLNHHLSEFQVESASAGKPTKSIPGDAKSGSNQLANSAAAFTEKYKAEGKAKQTGKRKGGDAKPVPKRAKESKTSYKQPQTYYQPQNLSWHPKQEGKGGRGTGKGSFKGKGGKGRKGFGKGGKGKGHQDGTGVDGQYGPTDHSYPAAHYSPTHGHPSANFTASSSSNAEQQWEWEGYSAADGCSYSS